MSLRTLPRRLLDRLGALYVRDLCRREFRSQQFLGINERPVEYRFVFEQLTQAFPRTVLDVGTGRTALPQLMRTCGFGLRPSNGNVYSDAPTYSKLRPRQVTAASSGST